MKTNEGRSQFMGTQTCSSKRLSRGLSGGSRGEKSHSHCGLDCESFDWEQLLEIEGRRVGIMRQGPSRSHQLLMSRPGPSAGKFRNVFQETHQWVCDGGP